MELNPYAPPESTEISSLEAHGHFEVVGKTLRVRHGTRLPCVCLCCGATHGDFSLRRKRFIALTQWRYLGLLFLPVNFLLALFSIVFLGFFGRRKATIEYCLLSQHLRPPLWRRVANWLSIASVFIGFGFVLAWGSEILPWSENQIYFALIPFISTFVFFVIGNLGRWQIFSQRAPEKDLITLKKIHPEALKRLAEWKNSQTRTLL